MQDADEPVLEKLDDVTVSIHNKPQMGFTINFHFQASFIFDNYEQKIRSMETFDVRYYISTTAQRQIFM